MEKKEKGLIRNRGGVRKKKSLDRGNNKMRMKNEREGKTRNKVRDRAWENWEKIDTKGKSWPSTCHRIDKTSTHNKCPMHGTWSKKYQYSYLVPQLNEGIRGNRWVPKLGNISHSMMKLRYITHLLKEFKPKTKAWSNSNRIICIKTSTCSTLAIAK